MRGCGISDLASTFGRPVDEGEPSASRPEAIDPGAVAAVDRHRSDERCGRLAHPGPSRHRPSKLAVLGWYGVGNVIDGIVLVAGLQLVRVGETKLEERPLRPPGQLREAKQEDGE